MKCLVMIRYKHIFNTIFWYHHQKTFRERSENGILYPFADIRLNNLRDNSERCQNRKIIQGKPFCWWHVHNKKLPCCENSCQGVYKLEGPWCNKVVLHVKRRSVYETATRHVTCHCKTRGKTTHYLCETLCVAKAVKKFYLGPPTLGANAMGFRIHG